MTSMMSTMTDFQQLPYMFLTIYFIETSSITFCFVNTGDGNSVMSSLGFDRGENFLSSPPFLVDIFS
jgi:hypothetical protein